LTGPLQPFFEVPTHLHHIVVVVFEMKRFAVNTLIEGVRRYASERNYGDLAAPWQSEQRLHDPLDGR